jgi:hypothetical protein
MDGKRQETGQWAREEFGHVRLGDERRRSRLLAMSAQLALTPAGKVSQVFRGDAERQGAYDLLESSCVHASALMAAMGQATARRCAGAAFAFVPLDGTSLTLVDHTRDKDFGAVGTYADRGRGLKVIDAIVVSPRGVPLGCGAMQWWSRPIERVQRVHHHLRPVDEKETKHWLDAIDQCVDTFRQHAPDTRAWFQLDREGDAWPILERMALTEHWFTVRSRSDRCVHVGHRTRRLRQVLSGKRMLGDYLLEVATAPGRSRRLACMTLKAATVTLEVRDQCTHDRHALTLNAVWVREQGTTPRGENPVDWLLLTNHPIDTFEACKRVVFGYTQRWRIEDFHKTWKSGVCNVESTQLHATAHVIKWATLLAAVAMRVERLKHLAREQPDLPASVELTKHEIRALILMKRKHKKRTETIPDTMPTVAKATLWLAEMGGYTGKSSGGPPGSITIGRGLERVLMAAEVLEILHSSRKKR